MKSTQSKRVYPFIHWTEDTIYIDTYGSFTPYTIRCINRISKENKLGFKVHNDSCFVRVVYKGTVIPFSCSALTFRR